MYSMKLEISTPALNNQNHIYIFKDKDRIPCGYLLNEKPFFFGQKPEGVWTSKGRKFLQLQSDNWNQTELENLETISRQNRAQRSIFGE